MENDMSYRFITLGIAALVAASPVQAQRRGTLELGAFGGVSSYDRSLSINDGAGGGLRIGAFLDPRWAIEVDGSGMHAGRPAAFSRDANVTTLSARLALTPLVWDRISWVISAGGVHADYGVQSSYGMSGLVGLKYTITERAALRVDAIADYMTKRKDTNTSLRAGLSFFRQPVTRVQTVTLPQPMAPVIMRRDSVSATEQNRLRLVESRYNALRDSLMREARSKQSAASSATASAATMREMIYFATDSSLLSDSAKATLDGKVAIFGQNPAMRIVIVGNTDERATDAYNLALGSRRAEAAKGYLVSKGIDAGRIEITSHGESQPIAGGTSTLAQGQNRRAEFRLLVASDFTPPKK